MSERSCGETSNDLKPSSIMNADGLQVRTYRSIEELQAIAPMWNDLLAEYPLATNFSTLEWLIPWWRAFGANQKLLVGGFFADTRLIGLAPLAISAFPIGKMFSLRVLRLMGDGSQDSDNLDLPVKRGYADTFAASLLHFLENERRSWDFCALNTLPPSSPGANALRKLIDQKKWVVNESRTPTSAIPLPATWEDYLKQLSSKERGKVGLRARRLEKKYKIRIRKCEHEVEIDLLLQALYELHGRHWQARGVPGTLHSPARRQFYGELARLLLQRRQLELWVLELDGRIAAAQFGLRYGTTLFSLQEGFDPEFASDSVGYVLRSQVLKEVIGDGIRSYDFLGGADESKLRWGAEIGHYLNLSFAPPLSRGAAYLRTRDSAGKSKAWLRSNLPAAAWKALHRINVGLKGSAKGNRSTTTREE
jgi:CelD/BcsL family acetyltransferase involved in cellulose biosynthesis